MADRAPDNDPDKVAETVAIAVLKPPRLIDPIQAIIDAVNVSAAAIGSTNMVAGVAVRCTAVLMGWTYAWHKYDRVKPALQAVAEQLERTRGDYVRKEEFGDVLEDCLRRLSNQPDPKRRDALRAILLNIMAAPREHLVNRRLLRLADELPGDAMVVLQLTVQMGDATLGDATAWDNLMEATQKGPRGVHSILMFLDNESLIESEGIWGIAPQTDEIGRYRFGATELGIALVTYMRE